MMANTIKVSARFLVPGFLALVLLATGCRDTTPKNVFAPLGPSTVAPPSTGSFGTPRTGQAQPYYTPNTQANQTSAPAGGLRTGQAPSLAAPPQAAVTNASGIRQIGFNSEVGTGVNPGFTANSPQTFQVSAAPNPSGGMHVNDATNLSVANMGTANMGVAPQPVYQQQQQVQPVYNQQTQFSAQPTQFAPQTLQAAPSQPAFTQLPSTTSGLQPLPANEVVPLNPIPRVSFPTAQPQIQAGVNGQFGSPSSSW